MALTGGELGVAIIFLAVLAVEVVFFYLARR
jgi:hypothetical protein